MDQKSGHSQRIIEVQRAVMTEHLERAALLRNFISFYHQAYRAAVWGSRHDILYSSAHRSRPYTKARTLCHAYDTHTI
jgi:hypothetical protein